MERTHSIPEDPSRLAPIDGDSSQRIGDVLESLRKDQVVLVRNLGPDEADALMYSIADTLGIAASLKLQAAFASVLGHRENIGRYYMSVNKREDYQFVAPHSEGNSFTNMQLSSFYCYENSTDGGDTVLMNIDESCAIWSGLREHLKKGQAKRALTEGEIRKIKVAFRLNMPEDALGEDDEILDQTVVSPFFSVYNVLAKPKRTHSMLLGRKLYAYWDSIERVDSDSAEEYFRFLSDEGLLKVPPGASDVQRLDDSARHRIRRFGSSYRQLFKCKVTRKLQPGDFIVQNNLTWCHSVANWTPGSGIRKVSAAFA
jgi:hypothetical protein